MKRDDSDQKELLIPIATTHRFFIKSPLNEQVFNYSEDEILIQIEKTSGDIEMNISEAIISSFSSGLVLRVIDGGRVYPQFISLGNYSYEKSFDKGTLLIEEIQELLKSDQVGIELEFFERQSNTLDSTLTNVKVYIVNKTKSTFKLKLNK